MTAKEQARTRQAAGLVYLLTRKQVKNLNLRVQKDGSIHVSAPPRVPAAAVDDFVARHRDFINEARARLAAKAAATPKDPLPDGTPLTVDGVPRRVICRAGSQATYRLLPEALLLTLPDPADGEAKAALFDRFLKDTAKALLPDRVAALLPRFAPHQGGMPALRFRTMKSKWGICRPGRGEITLNTRLVLLPPALADYVICHELAHFVHPDHSPAFWAHLEKILPDCKARRRALRDIALPWM